MRWFLLALYVIRVLAAAFAGILLMPRVRPTAVRLLRRSRLGRQMLGTFLRIGYLMLWVFGVYVAGGGLWTLITALFAGIRTRPFTTAEHAGELVSGGLVIVALALITAGISAALERAAEMSQERARLVRALLGASIAFVIYGVVGARESVLLGLSVNEYFRGHLFDAATLAALVTFGWLFVPAERPERPPLRTRLRAYGYFAAACGCIAALGGYTAGGGLGDVAHWALVGALAGWLLALGLIATRWQKANVAEAQVVACFSFTVGLPVDEVFERVNDPRRHPEWVGGLARVCGPKPTEAGSDGHEVWRIMPWPVNASYKITVWEPPHWECCGTVSRNLEFVRRIDLLPANIEGPTESALDEGGAMNHARTTVEVQLRMIATGKRRNLLKMVLGQPWAILGLNDQDRLCRQLSAPSRAEEGSKARVSWARIGQALRRVTQPPSCMLRKGTLKRFFIWLPRRKTGAGKQG